MGHVSKKSGDKRSSHKRFLIIGILLGIILIQISVAIYSSTALAIPRVDCADPMPSNNGASATPTPATPGIVLINEVLLPSKAQWSCTASTSTPDTEDAWVEIYNPQDQPLDLYAARAFFDNGQGTQSYLVPFGSIIAPHGFLVVFPFASFTQFSPIRLVISQIVIDQISVPSLATGTSYARIPDGSSNWQITTNPTIASSNALSTITPTTKATKTVSESTKTAKTKSATSTSTQTPKRKATSTQGGSTANDGASTDASNTGIQPTWSALRLPMFRSNNTTIDNTTQHNSSPSSTSSVPLADFPVLLSKILLTLLSVALIFAALGCWRLYQKRKGIRP